MYACVFGVCVAACAAQAARWQAGAVHSRPPAHLNVTHQCLQPTSDAATAHAVPRKAPAAGAASHALCYHTACPAARSPWGFKTGPPAVRQGSWGRRLRAWHNAVRRGATPAPPPASPCHQANRWRHSRATCSNACQKHSLVTGTTQSMWRSIARSDGRGQPPHFLCLCRFSTPPNHTQPQPIDCPQQNTLL